MTKYFGKKCEGERLPLTELQVGDTVEVIEGGGPYATGIVSAITDDLVWFWRPYGKHAGFTCGSPHGGTGVICYTGVETFCRPKTKRETILVWHRDDMHMERALRNEQELGALKNNMSPDKRHVGVTV